MRENGKRKAYFKNLGVSKNTEHKDIVISQTKDGTFKIGERLTVVEDSIRTTTFLKNGLIVKDMTALVALRDAINVSLEMVMGNYGRGNETAVLSDATEDIKNVRKHLTGSRESDKIEPAADDIEKTDFTEKFVNMKKAELIRECRDRNIDVKSKETNRALIEKLAADEEQAAKYRDQYDEIPDDNDDWDA